MKCTRIIIPGSIRCESLDGLNEGDQGIVRCRKRAKVSEWLPGYNFQEVREPMIPSDLPNRTWGRVRADLFNLHGTTYLVVVDYYSRFIEIAKLDHLKSRSFDVILHLKSMFSRH